jgi:hypothetical protein
VNEIDNELQRFFDEEGPFASEADALSKFFRWYWIKQRGVRVVTQEEMEAEEQELFWLK